MSTSTETCPSLEDLAAFLDGRLSADERARIVAHLADCPACYEVFTEAARFRLSEEEEDEEDEPPGKITVPPEPAADIPPANVVQFRRTRVVRWVSSIAAAVLAVGLVAVPLYQQYNTLPEMTSDQLVAPAVVSQTRQDGFWDQWNTRGEEEDRGADSYSPEFLIGARIVHLSVHLSRNDNVTALNDLASINGYGTQLGLLMPRKQAEEFKRIQGEIADGRRPADLVPELAKIEDELTRDAFSVDVTPYFAFGKWAEAGRLSALAQSPDFFQAQENRKFLRAFLNHERDLEPEVKDPLKAIQKTLDESDPSSLPYQDLRRQFESILKHYQEDSLKFDLS